MIVKKTQGKLTGFGVYISFLVSRCTFSMSHLVQLFGMELGSARELVVKSIRALFRQKLVSCSKPLQGNSGKSREQNKYWLGHVEIKHPNVGILSR